MLAVPILRWWGVLGGPPLRLALIIHHIKTNHLRNKYQQALAATIHAILAGAITHTVNMSRETFGAYQLSSCKAEYQQALAATIHAVPAGAITHAVITLERHLGHVN